MTCDKMADTGYRKHTYVKSGDGAELTKMRWQPIPRQTAAIADIQDL